MVEAKLNPAISSITATEKGSPPEWAFLMIPLWVKQQDYAYLLKGRDSWKNEV